MLPNASAWNNNEETVPATAEARAAQQPQSSIKTCPTSAEERSLIFRRHSISSCWCCCCRKVMVELLLAVGSVSGFSSPRQQKPTNQPSIFSLAICSFPTYVYRCRLCALYPLRPSSQPATRMRCWWGRRIECNCIYTECVEKQQTSNKSNKKCVLKGSRRNPFGSSGRSESVTWRRLRRRSTGGWLCMNWGEYDRKRVSINRGLNEVIEQTFLLEDHLDSPRIEWEPSGVWCNF